MAQSGVHIYLVGGTTAAGATADVQTTEVGEDGNFLPWAAGPALPEPRTDAAVVSLTGVPYVIGGLDAAGQPTTTVFMGDGRERRGHRLDARRRHGRHART